MITDSTGQFSIGIGANGELYDFGSGVGFMRLSDGYDPLVPGTPRDSWGVGSPTAGSAYADGAFAGTLNLAGTSSTINSASASAVTTTTIGLNVAQNYSFASPNILKISETISNVSSGALPVLFQRDVDWDVYPTEFDENTFGPIGSSPLVVGSSYFGFESPDPQVPYFDSCFGGCNLIGDLGGGIQVGLGTLGAGKSVGVTYYYGISESGQDVNQLISEAQHDGVSYIIATQSSEGGIYPALGADSAFIGVSVSAVPEPSSWAMLLIGFAGLGIAGYRRAKRPAATSVGGLITPSRLVVS